MRAMNGFAFGGEWEDWCDAARNTWASVTGNSAEADSINAKCKGWAPFAPSTDAGRLLRGLPANWSSDPNKVRAGAAAAVIGSIGTAVQTVAPTAQAVVSGGSASVSSLIAPGTQPVNMTTSGGAAMTQGQYVAATQAAKQSQTMMLLVAGAGILGIGALLYLRSKRRGGAVAGFGSYRSRRKSRRIRRRR